MTADRPPSQSTTNRALFYEARAAEYASEASSRQQEVRRLSWARLATFVVWVVQVWKFSPKEGALGLLFSVALIGVFAFFVRRYRRAKKRLRRVELMAEFNRDALLRLERDWAELPEPPKWDLDPHHPYARDLDVLGVASSAQLLGTPGTDPGWETLYAWLLKGAAPEVIRQRQNAVVETRDLIEIREAIAAEGRLAQEQVRSKKGAGREGFLEWAEGKPSMGSPWWLVAAAWVFPPINVGAAVGVYLDVWPTPVLAWALVLSAVVLGACTKKIHRVFGRAAGGEAGIRGYGLILRLLEETSFSSPWWVSLRSRLEGSARPAHSEIDRLRLLLDMADTRLSPMFHIPLALFLFWDVHVVFAMERWQSRSGDHVRGWVEAVGEAEALMALSALSHAHPDWVMPSVSEGATAFVGRDVGHPLLASDQCVGNDVEVGPSDSFLLVTGSNMAGKSTLLRAIGLNTVLARCGGPVCAAELTLPPLEVWTSMRVDDSLSGGLSFFMAELARLKRVVAGAESGTLPEGATTCNPVLYLLDEILQGTNTAERQVAARSVIRRLIRSGAIGAVTTHDLTLADAEDLVAYSVPIHFTETVSEGEEDSGLSFDYKLREGISPSTNALKLLRLVGLD